MSSLAAEIHLAGSAFDAIADSYDLRFTASAIGRAQRSVVWRKAETVFRTGDRVLELNCGTGEDALFLASRGVRVTACDASPRMIELARARRIKEAPQSAIEFQVLCSERLDRLSPGMRFDGVFSNFSGLNCVADLSEVARQLSGRLKAGAQLLLCLSTRFCLWEMLCYGLRADLRRATRRCRGSATVRVGGQPITVHYRSLRSLLRSFGPEFRLRSVSGVGVAVPPSYMEDWACRHPSIFRACQSADRVVHRWPLFRVLGDHVLLHMERV
ncbi:MAG TPA: methyltransferase domain-containing protein [Terracidiphilus sp.]|nr:methyltransferase domain-containing protein [Terracidiphilus sp.]